MEANKPRPFSWFWGVLSSPGEVYREVVEQPVFIKPALLLSGINLVLTVIMLPKLRAFTLWTLKQGAAQISPEQLATVQNAAVIGAMVAAVVFALLGPWLLWLLIAGILKLYDLVKGGGTPFGTLYAVAVYGYLPMLIGGAIQTAISFGVPVENFTKVSLSLAAFLPYQKSILYYFLSACNPFTWWSLALFGIGGAAAMKTRPGGVITLLFVYWLIYAVAAALLAVFKTPAGIG